MEKLTEKKRKWIIQQFRAGRSATVIAKIQHVSRRMVYKLVNKFKQEGVLAYVAKKAGRPSLPLNKSFVKKVVNIRQHDDYGAEKLHFVLKREGFTVSQRQIQKILDRQGLTEPCVKRRGQRTYVRYQWPISNYMWHVDWSEYQEKQYCSLLMIEVEKLWPQESSIMLQQIMQNSYCTKQYWTMKFVQQLFLVIKARNSMLTSTTKQDRKEYLNLK